MRKPVRDKGFKGTECEAVIIANVTIFYAFVLTRKMHLVFYFSGANAIFEPEPAPECFNWGIVFAKKYNCIF